MQPRGCLEFWEKRYAKEEWEWGREPSMVAREIGRQAAKLGYERVLDVGCGYGRDCIYLARLGLRPVGVDLSWQALCRARRWAATEAPAASFIRLDLAAWSFKPYTFRAIVCYNTLHLFPQSGRFLLAHQLTEALIPGGLLGLAVFSTAEDGYGKGQKVEEGTFLRDGRLRHYFTKQELVNLFHSFHCFRLEEITVVDKGAAAGEHIHREWLLIAEKEYLCYRQPQPHL